MTDPNETHETYQPLPGTYAFANNHVDPETGTLLVKALFPNPLHILRPGQYAKVRATVREIKDAIQVPQAAVQQLQGGYFVSTVGAGNKVVIKRVTPGETNGTQWVIESAPQAHREVRIGKEEHHELKLCA